MIWFTSSFEGGFSKTFQLGAKLSQEDGSFDEWGGRHCLYNSAVFLFR